jgi:hypothetical protein
MNGRHIGTAFLAMVAVSVSSCGAATPLKTNASLSHAFTYGFDFSIQAPDHLQQNDPAAVTAALGVLHRFSGSVMDQWIWGAGATSDPEPSPGNYDMSSIAARLSLIEAAGGIPVITLCCAPTWMKETSVTGPALFNAAPAPDHYRDFAALAAHVAQAFPNVHYFVVWSEVRGFRNTTTSTWDYRGYTTMYNDVFRAIKRVRSDAFVGGPYAVFPGYSQPYNGIVSAVHGPWGYVDQGMLETVQYWLRNKAGADFIALDGPTEVAREDDAALNDPLTASELYAAIDHWVEAQTPRPLPIWWMESHIQPTMGWTLQQATAARIATIALMAVSGASVGMQWQPQQQSGWPDEPLWTSTRQAGGGQPTALALQLPVVLAILSRPIRTIPGQHRGVLVVTGAAGTIIVNTTDAAAVVTMADRPVGLAGGEVITLPPP